MMGCGHGLRGSNFCEARFVEPHDLVADLVVDLPSRVRNVWHDYSLEADPERFEVCHPLQIRFVVEIVCADHDENRELRRAG